MIDHDRLTELFAELCEKDRDEQVAALTELGRAEPQIAVELVELLELDANDAIEPLLARFGGARAAKSKEAVETSQVASPMGIDRIPDHPRYQIIRKLGEGGLGIVYEALDRERGERVALKTFKRPGSDAMFRLKREFRSLAGIDHPNLVTLYDLVVEDSEVFFTMELIDGGDVLDFVRPDELSAGGGDRGLHCDEARLRQLLPQLARGLAALHQVGKLHRDIKPSNIRVTREGRVVLLDFGLAVDIEELESESLVDAVVGTIAYMSPEQACAERNLGPATDWYAFGVLLYEALTGARPFSGRPVEILAKKTQRIAPPPRQRVPEVPEDLDALCRGLLERNPDRRTRGAAVLEALGVDVEGSGTPATNSSSGQESQVLGRDAPIASLLQTFQSVQHTCEARTVVVSGPSGIGKSSVVTEFLRQVRRQHGEVVILRGRCYERETVSHRAMDEVIDGLSRFWRNLPELEAGVLCPQEPHLLPVLFPVLGRVAAVAQRRRHQAPSDPQECRNRAYAALRETFRKLATDRPVIMFVDDMQWADAESGALLADLLVPPHMPAIMLVLGTRDVEQDHDSSLAGVLRTLGDAVSILELPPLSAAGSEAIAEHLIGSGENTQALRARIVGEAGGNAYFLTELCRAALSADHPRQQLVTVEDLVRSRVAALSEIEQTLLEIVAVAGQPIAVEVVETAAAQTAARCSDGLRALRAAHLIRTSSGRRDGAVECYHSRVRDALLSAAEAEALQKIHLALAEALELHKSSASDRLAAHWYAANRMARAVHWALRAAADARETLNFSRSADFLALAIEHGTTSAEERRQLVLQWGDTLVEAGRAAEAASVFEQAMKTAPASEQLELRLRMVQQLLALGEIDRGLDAAVELTRSAGWKLPRSSFGTLAQILVNNMALRYIGDDPKLSTRTNDIQQRRRRVEVASELARSLSLSDSLRGVVCSQRAIRDGLRLDDVELRIRLLGMRSLAFAARGKAQQATRYLQRAETLATQHSSPAGLSYVAYGQGFFCITVSHEWKTAVASFDRGMRLWREAGRGEGWDMDALKIISLTARAMHGDLRATNHVLPQATLQYARSGRRFLEVMLRTKHGQQRVLANKPEQAIADVEDALLLWPDKARAYLLQHFYGLVSLVQADLYIGRPDRAEARLRADEKLLRRSQLLRVLAFRIEYEYVCARTHLALAAEAPGSEVPGHRKRAMRNVIHLEKIALPMAIHYATSLRATIALLDKDEGGAIAHLESAAAGFDQIETRLHAACARRRLGLLLGGDAGNELIAPAELWMAREDVKNPQRASALLFPV